jgi:hypothetical protein
MNCHRAFTEPARIQRELLVVVVRRHERSAPPLDVGLGDAEVVERHLEHHAIDRTHTVDGHPHRAALLEPGRDRVDRQ